MVKLLGSERGAPQRLARSVVGALERTACAVLLICSGCGAGASEPDAGAGGEPGLIDVGGATGGEPATGGASGGASGGSSASGGSAPTGGSNAGGSTASTSYLPCDSKADCSAYGGGKVCCETVSAGQGMRFCTKPSACSGQLLP